MHTPLEAFTETIPYPQDMECEIYVRDKFKYKGPIHDVPQELLDMEVWCFDILGGDRDVDDYFRIDVLPMGEE